MSQRFISFLVFVALILLSATALNAKLLSLTPSNFDEQLKSTVPTVVAFVAPWCGHCQRAKPELEKAAEKLGGVVHFATVDCEEHKDLAGRHNIRGFPTIKIFSNEGRSVDDYNGARSAGAFVNYAMTYFNKLSDPTKVISSVKDALNYLNENIDKTRVVLLTGKSSNPSLFKSLAIEFEKLPLDFAVVTNAENYADSFSSLGIEKFPALLFVDTNNEAELKDRITLYSGQLKKYDIMEYIKKLIKGMDSTSKSEEGPKTTPLKQTIQKVKEVSSQDEIDTNCERLCIIGLLGSDDKRDVFASIAKNQNEQGFPFLSINVKKHKELRELFNVNVENELTLVALRMKRKKFAKSENVSEEKNAESFLERISYGDITYTTLKSLPKLHEEL